MASAAINFLSPNNAQHSWTPTDDGSIVGTFSFLGSGILSADPTLTYEEFSNPSVKRILNDVFPIESGKLISGKIPILGGKTLFVTSENALSAHSYTVWIE